MRLLPGKGIIGRFDWIYDHDAEKTA